jgi:hypothetical protein
VLLTAPAIVHPPVTPLASGADLAMNQDVAFTTFTDATDLLVDITGATGTIATSNFI